jgi:hypothetical protein
MDRQESPMPHPIISYAAASPPRWRPRKVVALVVVGLLLVAGAYVCLPSYHNHDRHRHYALYKCQSNLSQIGKAILLYTNENRGALPPDLATAAMTQGIEHSCLTCPSTDTPRTHGMLTAETANALRRPGPGLIDYVYLGGGRRLKEVGPSEVLAYETGFHHNIEGMNVLFGDCHAEFLKPADVRVILDQPNAGVPYPCWPTTRATGSP